MSVDMEWITRELRTTLGALAADGIHALTTVRDGCVKADELALDYDNFVHAYLGNCGDAVSRGQRDALLRVDELLSAMSDPGHAHLWTEEAVIGHARWTEVRAAAREAVAALGWVSA
jgi:hypothetical protein